MPDDQPEWLRVRQTAVPAPPSDTVALERIAEAATRIRYELEDIRLQLRELMALLRRENGR